MIDRQNLIIVILLMAIGFMGHWLFNRSHDVKPIDTPKIDTIPFYMPILHDSVVTHYETVRLPVANNSNKLVLHDTIITHDTIFVADSIDVEIPITTKKYEDSLYTAYVSGYNPRLDSIKVYNKVAPLPKRYRWGLEGQVGYDVTNNSQAPYIELGLTYELSKRIELEAHAGYDLIKNNLSPYIGVGVTYKIVQW